MYIYKATLRGPLNLTDSCRLIFLPASDRLSPVRPGLAELSVIGPWLAPLCPAINPNPLALGTVGQGSLPNPSPLLPSTLQLEHAKLSPPLHPLLHPQPSSQQHISHSPSPIIHCRSSTHTAFSSPSVSPGFQPSVLHLRRCTCTHHANIKSVVLRVKRSPHAAVFGRQLAHG